MKPLVAMLAAFMALAGTAVDAASFSSGGRASFSSSRSFSGYSRPSYSYTKPATPTYTYRPSTPAPQKAPTVVHKNVTVQQNVTHVTQVSQVSHASGSSGGGFFSSFLGSMAGTSISNWLFPPKAQPAPAPVQQVIDCSLEQNKPLAVCQQLHPSK